MNTSTNDMFGIQQQRKRAYGMALNTRRQWFADDDPVTPDTDPATGDTDPGQKDGTDGEKNGGKQEKVTFSPEQQAEVDRVVGKIKRQTEERTSARITDELKTKSDKAASDAEKVRLQKAGEFEALNTTLTGDVERLTADLETAGADFTTQTEELDKYKALIQAQVDKLSASVPEHVKTLLADKQPADQLAWLTEYGEAMNQTAQLGTPGGGQRGNGKQKKSDEKAKGKPLKSLIPRM